MYKILGLGILTILVSLPIVGAGAQVEKPQTFLTCYGDTAASLLLVSMFTPTKINLNDPAVKTYITNYCNFYHEKLGKWLSKEDMPKIGNITGQDIALWKEFEAKYRDTIPPSILELGNNVAEVIKTQN